MSFLFVTVPATVLPSILLLWFFHSRDRYPEPSRVVWATFGYGMAITVPVVVCALLLQYPATWFVDAQQQPVLHGLLQAFLGAAIPEESLKLSVLLCYCLRHSAFDEPMDGVVYGAAVSLGFATFENVLYVLDGGLTVAILRALTAVPGHALLGVIMGFYVGQLHLHRDRRRSLLLMAWGVPVLLHGLYDFPLMAADGLQGAAGLVVFAAPLVLLCEWLLARALWRRGRIRQDRDAIR